MLGFLAIYLICKICYHAQPNFLNLIKTMKKIIFLSLACLLTACGDKDATYYEANPEKAQAKITECQQKIHEALTSKNKDKIEKISADAQCQAADTALRNLRQKEREAKRAALEAEKAAMLADANKIFEQQYGNLSHADYLNTYLQSDCIGKGYFSSLNKDNALCWLMRDKQQTAIKTLSEQYAATPFDELIAQGEAMCKLNQQPDSSCGVWRKELMASAKNTFADKDPIELKQQTATYCDTNHTMKHQICSAFESAYYARMQEAAQAMAKNDAEFRKNYQFCHEKSQTLAAYAIREQYPLCEIVYKTLNIRNLYHLSDFKTPL